MLIELFSQFWYTQNIYTSLTLIMEENILKGIKNLNSCKYKTWCIQCMNEFFKKKNLLRQVIYNQRSTTISETIIEFSKELKKIQQNFIYFGPLVKFCSLNLITAERLSFLNVIQIIIVLFGIRMASIGSYIWMLHSKLVDF